MFFYFLSFICVLFIHDSQIQTYHIISHLLPSLFLNLDYLLEGGGKAFLFFFLVEVFFIIFFSCELYILHQTINSKSQRSLLIGGTLLQSF